MRSFTEDEHIALSEAGTEFCQQLAQITAAVIAKFPTDIEDDVRTYLQDQTSLFSPFTFDETTREVQRLRESGPSELVRSLVTAIHEFRELAAIASKRPGKLSTLGDTSSGFYGRAEGLHQALFLIDRDVALTV